jgi:hypothetical protein
MQQEDLWGDILDRLEDQYGKLDIEKLSETREDDTGQKITSEIQRVEFETTMGRMRVELVKAPLILDKKTHYTHTAGARASVEYILSDTETTTKVRAFRYDKDMDEWTSINVNGGFLA